MSLLIILRDVAFSVPSMVSGLLIQPHIFWQFYLREIWGLLIGLGLLKL